MGFSRQGYWSGLPFPSPGDLPDPGIEPGSPALLADALPSEPPRKPEKHSRTSYPMAACTLASGHLGLEIRTLYHCTLYSESERKEKVKIAQLCLTLCDPMDCSLSGSSIHGIFQARVLEWIAISFSRGSSRPRNRTRVSRIAGRRFTV